MTLRRIRRAVTLAFALAFCIVRYVAMRARGPMTMARRVVWLQRCCASVARCVGLRIVATGRPPAKGLLVANHLGYLDIVAMSAVAPCCFVAKMEVDRWPFFGWAARGGGTVFLDRASRRSAGVAAEQIMSRLRDNVPVLLFPEGTSTDGTTVLRFHTRLIDPAVRAGVPVTPGAIRYDVWNGTPEREVCWYDDAGFLEHLWKVLGYRGVTAHLNFGVPETYQEARSAAQRSHDVVDAMRRAPIQTER